MERTRLSQLSSDEPLRTRNVNGATTLTVAPAGTGVSATIVATAQSDVANASRISISVDGSLAYLTSDAIGTGVQLSLSITVGGSERMRIYNSGLVVINAPSSGQAFQVYGLANQYVASFISSTVSGQGYGFSVQAGSTSADNAISVTNRASTATLLAINGLGNTVFTLTGAGSYTFNGWPGQGVVYVYSGQTSGTSYGVQVQAGYTTEWALYCVNRAGTQGLFQVSASGATQCWANAVNTLALQVTGIAQQYTAQFLGALVSGQSYGFQIAAGYTSADSSVLIYNRPQTRDYFHLYGNGQLVVNASQGLIGAQCFTVYGGAEAQWTAGIYSTNTGGSFGLLISAGNNTADATLQVQTRTGSYNSIYARGDALIQFAGGLSLSTALQAGQFYAANAPNVANASGQMIAQSHITWSSINSKRNIAAMATDGQGVLDLVRSVRGVRYQHHWATQRRAKVAGVWDWQVEHHDTPSVGFIAEEVMQLLPEVISRDQAGNMGIDYGRMVPVLWEAVKELSEQVATLTSQLQTQRGPANG